MEPPDRWRYLQTQFRGLPDPGRELWAFDLDDGTWVVWGGPKDRVARESLQQLFRALAKRAALSADLSGRGTLVDAWLNCLKRGPFYHVGVRSEPIHRGPRMAAGGWIDCLCIASVECCVELEKASFEDPLRRRPVHKNYKTALARNVDRLRRECGWSFNALSKASGVDKKAILRHVNAGGRAKVRTLNAYAEAFSKELHRIVTAEELRGNAQSGSISSDA